MVTHFPCLFQKPEMMDERKEKIGMRPADQAWDNWLSGYDIYIAVVGKGSGSRCPLKDNIQTVVI